MNVFELIEKLTELSKKCGKVEVGIYNQEFFCFEEINNVESKEVNKEAKCIYNEDSVLLGEKFIGIE